MASLQYKRQTSAWFTFDERIWVFPLWSEWHRLQSTKPKQYVNIAPATLRWKEEKLLAEYGLLGKFRWDERFEVLKCIQQTLMEHGVESDVRLRSVHRWITVDGQYQLKRNHEAGGWEIRIHQVGEIWKYLPIVATANGCIGEGELFSTREAAIAAAKQLQTFDASQTLQPELIV